MYVCSFVFSCMFMAKANADDDQCLFYLRTANGSSKHTTTSLTGTKAHLANTNTYTHTQIICMLLVQNTANICSAPANTYRVRAPPLSSSYSPLPDCVCFVCLCVWVCTCMCPHIETSTSVRDVVIRVSVSLSSTAIGAAAFS